MTVAVIGVICGGGHLPAMSRATGPYGRVLGVNLHRDCIDYEQPEQPNIQYVQGSVEDPKLAAASIDVAMLKRFRSGYQESTRLLALLRSAIKPGGTLVLGEYGKFWDEDAYLARIEANGFEKLSRFEQDDNIWFLFRRP